jgi:hypothetical protein
MSFLLFAVMGRFQKLISGSTMGVAMFENLLGGEKGDTRCSSVSLLTLAIMMGFLRSIGNYVKIKR